MKESLKKYLLYKPYEPRIEVPLNHLSPDSRTHARHDEVPTEATKGEGENGILVEPPEYAISDERIDDYDRFVLDEQFIQTLNFRHLYNNIKQRS